MILALTVDSIHVDCRAMSHPVQQGDKNFHVSCCRTRMSTDLIASSLGSIPYPTAMIFKKCFQVTVHLHRTQTL